MSRVERLRSIAETCRKIAGGSQEWRGENLRTLAREFEERATRLEAAAKRASNPDSEPN